MIRLKLVLGAILVASLVGCAPRGGGQVSGPPPEFGPEAKAAGATSGSFGSRLYLETIKGRESENLILSPLSAQIVLALAAEGAKGETRAEMLKALGLDGLSEQQITNGMRELATKLQGRKDVAISLANSIWVRDGFPVLPEFLKTADAGYGAKAANLDFASPSAAPTINKWVSDHTNGRIKDLIKEIGPLTMMYLINALHFQGQWVEEIKKEDTYPSDFLVTAEDKVRATFMRIGNDQKLRAAWSEHGAAIAVPYKGEGMSMFAMIPKPDKSLADLRAAMGGGQLEKWVAEALSGSAQGQTAYFPKFKLEMEAGLVDALKGLGMQLAFEGGPADFSGISQIATKLGLHIGDVRQKTFVEVNEQGTEAAAATVVKFDAASAMVDEELQPLNFNRPFLFGIVDNATGGLLFLGQVTDPSK
jgi:serine protease inhibitor